MNNAIELVVDGVYEKTGVKVKEEIIDAEWRWVDEPSQGDIDREINRINDAIRHGTIGHVLANEAHERVLSRMAFKQKCFSTWDRMARNAGITKKR